MNMEVEQDEFLSRIAKTLYYGKPSSFDSISLPLSELAAEIFSEVKKDSGLERLHVKEVAEFNQNACVSTCSLVLAILYLEKVKTTNPEYVEKIAPSELFLVSLLVASKFLNDDGEDESISNFSWSIYTGLPLKKINEIEKKFLHAIGWNVNVTEKQFWSRLSKIEKYLASRAGKRRGWYSYTELNVLLSSHELIITKEFFKHSILCLTCYTASIILLITSGLLAIYVKHILLQSLLNVSFTSPDPRVSDDLDIPSVNDVKYLTHNTAEKIIIPVVDRESENFVYHNLSLPVCNSALSCYFENISYELNHLRVKYITVNWKMKRLRSNAAEIIQKKWFL